MKKLILLLMLTTGKLTSSEPDTSHTKNTEELLKRAQQQLERLSTFQHKVREITVEKDRSSSKQSQKKPVALELFELLPEDLQKHEKLLKKLDNGAITLDFINADDDPDRTKRSGNSYGGGYGTDYGGGGAGGSGGSDSGSFISGIATKIISGVAGASGASSSSSSKQSSTSNTYGPPSYGPKDFSVWDFKKAIINTLLQAVKAIGGGVLALKGQLIKGGGLLVSATGRLISVAGEGTSSLGRNLASSAVIAAPAKPSAYPTAAGYSYDAPSYQSHDATYDGPPPSAVGYSTGSDNYGHTSYGTSSDDTDHAGLVVAKPATSDQHPYQHQDEQPVLHQPQEYHPEEHHLDLDPRHPSSHSSLSSFNEDKTPNAGNVLNHEPIVDSYNAPVANQAPEHFQNFSPDDLTPPLPEKENSAGFDHLQAIDHLATSFQGNFWDNPNLGPNQPLKIPLLNPQVNSYQSNSDSFQLKLPIITNQHPQGWSNTLPIGVNVLSNFGVNGVGVQITKSVELQPPFAYKRSFRKRGFA